eukprot:TRINITY_DN1562_c0_g2_i4.p1 TRINITY_DN1562_c0_g2~~TRINITY_DN1562_c0_g2_i4.p1  ORF type:complete len:303 (-),score=100.86 TRINITY_DN1562_c0_g2_i4:47-955(-)
MKWECSNNEDKRYSSCETPEDLPLAYTDVRCPWVRCDHCDKWRKLPVTVDIEKLPPMWNCTLSPVPYYNRCEVPQECEDWVVEFDLALLHVEKKVYRPGALPRRIKPVQDKKCQRSLRRRISKDSSSSSSSSSSASPSPLKKRRTKGKEDKDKKKKGKKRKKDEKKEKGHHHTHKKTQSKKEEESKKDEPKAVPEQEPTAALVKQEPLGTEDDDDDDDDDDEQEFILRAPAAVPADAYPVTVDTEEHLLAAVKQEPQDREVQQELQYLRWRNAQLEQEVQSLQQAVAQRDLVIQQLKQPQQH